LSQFDGSLPVAVVVADLGAAKHRDSIHDGSVESPGSSVQSQTNACPRLDGLLERKLVELLGFQLSGIALDGQHDGSSF
jgi:hypothetical protein